MQGEGMLGLLHSVQALFWVTVIYCSVVIELPATHVDLGG